MVPDAALGASAFASGADGGVAAAAGLGVDGAAELGLGPSGDSVCVAGLLQAPSTHAMEASAVIDQLENFVRGMVWA